MYYEITPTTANAEDAAGTIGGAPHLPSGTGWPTCRICEQELVSYLDLELPREQSVPFIPGSRLQIFACREHDEIAGTIYTDYQQFSSAGMSRLLPRGYWDLHDGHYLIRLIPPSVTVEKSKPESRLLPRAVLIRRCDERVTAPSSSFKLFGEPAWLQDAEDHECSCGARMRLLLQLPENFGFDMSEVAAQQPNSFSTSQYCLFLGNQLYLLACERQCNPLALWPVLQN